MTIAKPDAAPRAPKARARRPRKPPNPSLPLWPEELQACSARCLRAAIFPEPGQSQSRPWLRQTQLWTDGRISVEFTGEQLDQTDLQVYMKLVESMDQDGQVSCSEAELLAALGRAPDRSEGPRVRDAIMRLTAAKLDIRTPRAHYFGHLLASGTRDTPNNSYLLQVNPVMVAIFDAERSAIIHQPD